MTLHICQLYKGQFQQEVYTSKVELGRKTLWQTYKYTRAQSHSTM